MRRSDITVMEGRVRGPSPSAGVVVRCFLHLNRPKHSTALPEVEASDVKPTPPPAPVESAPPPNSPPLSPVKAEASKPDEASKPEEAGKDKVRCASAPLCSHGAHGAKTDPEQCYLI